MSIYAEKALGKWTRQYIDEFKCYGDPDLYGFDSLNIKHSAGFTNRHAENEAD